MLYKISVMAMFKNESWIIKEWIEHYLSEGIEHFYLIDNGSTDDYEIKINDYMNYITLVKDPLRLKSNTQSYLYNKIFLNKVKEETEWLIICDIDEYMYARNGYSKIIDALNVLPQHMDKIFIRWKLFGSNKHIKQPESVIKGFTKRKYGDAKCCEGKTIVKTKNLEYFGRSGHDSKLFINNILYSLNGDIINNKKYLIKESDHKNFNIHFNHYKLMSYNYYKQIKCSRGGGDTNHTSGKYNMKYFNKLDENYNSYEDLELYQKYFNIKFNNKKLNPEQNSEQKLNSQQNRRKKNYNTKNKYSK